MNITALVFLCLGAGALLDFVFNGVFKIVWIVIYAPAYLAVCKGLMARLSGTPRERSSRAAAGALLGGALAMHLLFTGARREETYLMRLSSSEPITLRSEDWPQKLILASDALAKKLAGGSPPQELSVIVSRVTDYGCTRSFAVESVAGVDVRTDPGARWTWKTDPGAAVESAPRGPGFEDQRLPWCWFKFYRGAG